MFTKTEPKKPDKAMPISALPQVPLGVPLYRYGRGVRIIHPYFNPLSIASNLLPRTSEIYSIGSVAKKWLGLYLRNFSVDALGNVVIVGSIGLTGALSAGTSTLFSVVPALDDTYDLGTTAKRWAILWLSSYLFTGAEVLPVAGAAYRGAIIRVEGGAGFPDVLYVCLRNSDGTYSWVQIASGT